MKDSRRDVIHAGFEAHQPKIVFDTGTHGEEGTRYVVTIGEVVLGDHRRGLFVVHVSVRIGLFKFAQRLDAVVGNDNEISVIVDMLQDAAQYLVKRDVLVWESFGPN